MHARLLPQLLAAVASAVVIAPAARAMTLSSGAIMVYAQPEQEAVFDRVVFLTSPNAGTLSVDWDDSVASTDYDISDFGVFLDFEHAVAPNANALAASPSDIRFVPDVDVDYLLSGTYTATGADDREVFFRVLLQDQTESVPVFESYQVSVVTPEESFALGESDGDEYNSIVGSLSGTLLAGHEYKLYVLATVTGLGIGAPPAAFASGSVSLDLVPEPDEALLAIVGVLSLAAQCRRAGATRVARHSLPLQRRQPPAPGR